MQEPNEAAGLAGLGGTIGIEGFAYRHGEAVATMPVVPAILQPFGIVHGGAYSALAETVASRATYDAVAADGMGAFGQSITTSFLRPVAEGSITASARPVHRGRTSWVWQVEMRDSDDRLCAVAQMTIAIRPLGPPTTISR